MLPFRFPAEERFHQKNIYVKETRDDVPVVGLRIIIVD